MRMDGELPSLFWGNDLKSLLQRFWRKPPSHKAPIIVTGFLLIFGIAVGLTPVDDEPGNLGTGVELVSEEGTPADLSPNDTVTVEPTETSTPAPNAPATPAEMPSQAPTQPIAATPTPTASSGFTQAEIDYMDAAERRTGAVQVYLNDLNFTLGLENLYSSREEWLREVEAITEMVRFTAQMVADLRSPSTRFNDSNSALTAAASATIEAMRLLDQGLRNHDPAALDEADRLLNEQVRLLDEAARLLPSSN